MTGSRRPTRSATGPMTSWPSARPKTHAVSVSCTWVSATPNSSASVGYAGRYRSMRHRPGGGDRGEQEQLPRAEPAEEAVAGTGRTGDLGGGCRAHMVSNANSCTRQPPVEGRHSSRSCLTTVSSRPGPTPIALIREPLMRSSASTYALGRGGQVLEAADAGDVLGPALEVLVDRRRVVEVRLADRHLVEPPPVDVVGDADRDAGEAGEGVELGDDEVGDPVHALGVAGDDRVVPAAAAGAAGRGAVLVADGAQLLAVVVEELGGERALADARRVRLDHGDDPVHPGRRDPAARAGPARGRVGARDERVGAVVDVEQRGLAALEQHGLPGVQRLVEHQAGVGDVRLEPAGQGEQAVGDLVDGDRAAVVDLDQQVVLLVEGALDLLPQDLLVEQVLDPDPDAVDLVGVGRADAAAGGADALLAEEPLAHLVQRAVVGGDDVGVGRDEQARAVDAAGGEAVDLLEQHLGVDDHAVADDRHHARAEDPRRQQVQRVLLVAHDHGVPGVVAAVELDDEVDAGAEGVGRLALALVTPLGADQHDCGHAGSSGSGVGRLGRCGGDRRS